MMVRALCMFLGVAPKEGCDETMLRRKAMLEKMKKSKFQVIKPSKWKPVGFVAAETAELGETKTEDGHGTSSPMLGKQHEK